MPFLQRSSIFGKNFPFPFPYFLRIGKIRDELKQFLRGGKLLKLFGHEDREPKLIMEALLEERRIRARQ